MLRDNDRFIHFIPLVAPDGRLMVDIGHINLEPVYGSFGISANSEHPDLAWELLRRIMEALLEAPP